MAKVRICDLAKEIDVTSKDIIDVCAQLGIEAKSSTKGLEENEVASIKSKLGKASKDKEVSANKAPAKEEPVKKAEAEEAPKAPVKAAEAEAPKKKKKIVMMSSGSGNGAAAQRPQQPAAGPRNTVVTNSGRPAPNRPIRPLTPPSPTPSVNIVANPNKGQENRKPQVDKAKEQAATPEVNTNAPAASNANASNANATSQSANQANNAANAPSDRNQNQNQNRKPEGKVIVTDTRNQSRGDRPYGQNGGQKNSFRPDSNRSNGDNRNGANRGQGNSQNGQGGNRGQRPFGNNSGRPQGNGAPDTRFVKKAGGGSAFISEGPKENNSRRDDRHYDKDKKNKKDLMYEDGDMLGKGKNKAGRFIKPEKKQEVEEEVIKVITIPETITIKDLADKMKQQASAIVKKLFLAGKMVTVNEEISYEEAENIAMEYEILCEKEIKVDVIEELLKEEEEDTQLMTKRPPVICVMGHVDHGKTSLLDAIRKTNVTDREAGGITQAIGAYTVNVDGQSITFLDTPGHEAFTAMRMRGANSTDIAVLVVAADDGVMPQTVEAINHAKAAGIEIIVAVNKIDKPGANVDRVKQELTEYELIATDWGGSTEFVPVSAKSGEGISDLLETIILTSDILELKANANRKARGLVIEAQLDKGRGPVATVLVQKGTLHVGDFISAGSCHGKVRAMVDDKGRRVKEATPSTPVEILGLDDVPNAGEIFIAHVNDKEAKYFADTFKAQNREKLLEETKSKMSLGDLFSQIQAGNLKELKLIVKADVQGSVEAVKASLMKLSNDEVVVKCIHGGVGAINESDVILASASSAIIIGFNVRPDAQAKETAEREGVEVKLYNVIYQAIDDVEAAMKGMLDPIFEEKVIGHAEIQQIFKASAIGNIAGARVMDGNIQRDCKVRITREGELVFEGALASLKRFKDDVKEVKEGFECGLVFEGYDQMQELDMVEAYIMVEVPR